MQSFSLNSAIHLLLGSVLAGCVLAACGGTGLPEECKESCDDLAFFSCVEPDEIRFCNAGCDDASSAQQVKDFIACVDADFGCNSTDACLAILGVDVGGGGGAALCTGVDLAQCQNTCSTIDAFSCFLDSGEPQSCFNRCNSATMGACENFAGCDIQAGDCSGMLDCYQTFTLDPS